jgi:hypothetical protein
MWSTREARAETRKLKNDLAAADVGNPRDRAGVLPGEEHCQHFYSLEASRASFRVRTTAETEAARSAL